MPIGVTVDHVAHRVTQVLEDPIVLSEVMHALDEQVAAQAWSYGAVVDGTRTTWVPDRRDHERLLVRLAELVQANGRRGPVAMLAGAHVALFGMFRMFATTTDPRYEAVCAFRERADAEAWLAAHAPAGSTATDANVRVDIDAEHRLVTETYCDRVTLDQIVNTHTKVAARQAWRYPALIVCCGTPWIPGDPDLESAAAHVARITRECGPRGPMAIVGAAGAFVVQMVEVNLAAVDADDAIPVFGDETEAKAALADRARSHMAVPRCPRCHSARVVATASTHGGDQYYFCPGCAEHWSVSRHGVVRPIDIDFDPESH